ncbi:MAG TPA: hypothetical protein VFF31_01065 [Blastocatellia bacterium]|nr:hypothetical protein [Blastocatellia bacterium]
MANFIRLNTTLLFLPEGSDQSTARNGYLLPEGTVPPQNPISLADSLSAFPGAYVFFPGLPYGDVPLDDFIRTMWNFLTGSGAAGTRFAWFASDDPDNLKAQGLVVNQEGTDFFTKDRHDFDFANYSLRLSGRSKIDIDKPGSGFDFVPPGEHLLLVTPLGTEPQVTFPVLGPVNLALLSGAGDGCFGFAVNTDDDGLNSLDVGLRYFKPAFQQPGYVDSLRYPLLDLAAAPRAGVRAIETDPTQLELAVKFDPTDQFNIDRTFFGFAPAVTGAAPAPLRSYFRNPLGEVVRVVPGQSAKLVFSTLVSFEPSDEPAPDQPYYLTPSGDFLLSVDNAQSQEVGAGNYSANLMCGISAVEYIEMAGGAPTVLTFQSGANAYTPTDYETNPDTGEITGVKFSPFTSAATTSYAYVSAKASPQASAVSLDYYAQPQSSVLHVPLQVSADSDNPSFLFYGPMIAGSLAPESPEAAEAPQNFPMVPYAGITADSFLFFQQLELQLISPTRRNTIPGGGGNISPRIAALMSAAGVTQGTTPQGLLLDLDNQAWQSITLGQSELESPPADNIKGPSDGARAVYTTDVNLNLEALLLYHVDGVLKTSLQSNQLFLVVSSAAKFLKYCSIPYVVTSSNLLALHEQGNVPEVITQALAPLVGNTYDTLASYLKDVATQLVSYVSSNPPYVLTDQILNQLATMVGVPQTAINALQDIAGTSFATLGEFQSAIQSRLSASDFQNWGSIIILYGARGYAASSAAIISFVANFKVVIQGFEFNLSPYDWDKHKTILIFKYYDKSINSLKDSLEAWSNADEFNDGSASVQQQLSDFINDARNRKDPDLDYFLNTVIDSKNWNGIVALNCPVPLKGLPEQLEGLAAGIDPAQFAAHHVGINITPVQVTGTTLSARPSSMFGLIDYNDPLPLNDPKAIYQYKVLSLKTLMLDSTIMDFSSQVELLVNYLFGDLASLKDSQKGNVLDFNGVYQKQGDKGTYVFTNRDLNKFTMTSQVLETVVVSRAQFVTLAQEQGDTSAEVKTKFLFSGLIAFKALDGFDVFPFGTDDGSQGGLAYSALSIDMSFDANIPSYKTFTFDISGIVLDTTTSTARRASLYNHFPLKLTALVQGGADSRPDKQNYMPVATPLSGQGLTDTWFALVYSLNLGTPGALAAQVGFSAGFISAWSPATTQPSLFIGLSLPGVKGGERAITLQGVVKLTFGDISFLVNDSNYILQLRNIALSILSISIPPSGQTNIVLFGDPTGSDRETLGWYAAYVKAQASQQKPRALPGVAADVAQLSNLVSTRVMKVSKPAGNGSSSAPAEPTTKSG